MKRPPPSRRRVAGFTLVELLLSLALGVLVALILSALLRGLLAADQAQSLRLRGPLTTRGALRTMSREIAAAFPPPGTNTIPLQLEAAPTPGQIESRLTLHVPVPLDPPIAGAYNMAQVTYQVRSPSRDRQILERIHVPCSGPATNQPVTNSLLEGRFTLVLEAITNGVCRADWPPARDTNAPSLPEAIRLTLTQPGKEPLTSTALIQTAHGISAPGERPAKEPPAP